jgi:hypothetical protein
MNSAKPSSFKAVIYLVKRVEVEGLLGRELSRAEWKLAKSMFMNDKELWLRVDDTLMLIADEIGKQKI